MLAKNRHQVVKRLRKGNMMTDDYYLGNFYYQQILNNFCAAYNMYYKYNFARKQIGSKDKVHMNNLVVKIFALISFNCS